jgi:plasmid maintenance system antidote protein VapI
MKFSKYTIKIPIPNTNEYTERIFYTMNEVCNFLEIKETVVYKIIYGEYKCTHKKSMRLKGIIITKEEISSELKEELKKKYELEDCKKNEKQRKKDEETNIISLEFHKKLLDKVI